MYRGNLEINIYNSNHFNALINFQLFKTDYSQKSLLKNSPKFLQGHIKPSQISAKPRLWFQDFQKEVHINHSYTGVILQLSINALHVA